MGAGNTSLIMETTDIFTDEVDRSLMTSFAWWEKRRLVYNLLMALSGLFAIILIGSFYLDDLVVVLLYGVIANLFYSLGFFIEIGARYYFKSDRDFAEIRKTLFGIGLAISIGVTIAIGMLFSIIT